MCFLASLSYSAVLLMTVQFAERFLRQASSFLCRRHDALRPAAFQAPLPTERCLLRNYTFLSVLLSFVDVFLA